VSAATGVRTRRCLVIGSPIRHSRSPLIHRLFAEQCGLALRYEKCEVAPGALRAALADFIAAGILGVNVTVPLKEEAWALADSASERARLAEAANVLSLAPDGRVRADNTDGLGLLADFAAQGIAVEGRRVLLLGAGGAARGVVPALLDRGVASLVLANRTPARAIELVTAFARLGPIAQAAVDAEFAQPFDVVVNGTSIGVASAGQFAIAPSALGPATVCYDLVYGSAETPFLRWARERGVARRVDGLGMLVEQAAESFRLWRGVMPDTEPVYRALRESIGRP
jgi:shikimate dehydrogenase